MTITFSLTLKGKPLIRSPQEVDFTTPLVKKTILSEVKIPLSQELNIPPNKIFLHLTRFVGEEIKKGEVIAEKKSFFEKKQYVSEYDGTIKEIDHEKGLVVVSTSQESQETIFCYFRGKIDEVKNQEVTLEVKEAKSFLLKQATADFGGEVVSLNDTSLTTVDQEKITKKVVLIEAVTSYNQVKLEVMGTKGFVTRDSDKQSSSMPIATVKDSSDWEAMNKLNLPYCVIDKKNNTIYFYAS